MTRGAFMHTLECPGILENQVHWCSSWRGVCQENTGYAGQIYIVTSMGERILVSPG